MNRPAVNVPASSSSARSYQQLLTKLLRHGAYPQLRKVMDKTLPADLSPVLPLLLEEDRKRIVSLLIEAGKAARTLLELDEADLNEIISSLDDAFWCTDPRCQLGVNTIFEVTRFSDFHVETEN